MSNETKKSALDQLKELQQKDAISTLDFNEPELKTFDYANVFEVEESPEKKPFIFGKRANRHATVKIKEAELEEKPKIEDVMKSNGFGINSISDQEVKEEPVIEEVPEEIQPIQEVEIEHEVIKEADFLPAEEEPKEIVAEEEIEVSEEETPVETEEDESEEIQDEELDEEFEESSDDEQINASDETESVFDEDEEDLFYEKKKFLLSQYQKEEVYLEQKSREGFHFIRNVGKKFYFVQGEPTKYYYSINYFGDEPDAQQWRDWEKDGWKLVSRSPAKKKKEAGWFVFRNVETKGEYRKAIENEEEKYRFYRKYSNSCRSTMFLIFMCMAMCAVAAYLQWEFKGYLWGFALCGVVFFISFVLFCMYGRMLRNSKKVARMLQAKIRTKERRAAFYAQHTLDTSESEEELDTDWNTLESESTKTQKLRRTRR